MDNNGIDIRAPLESDLTKSMAVTLESDTLELRKLDKLLSEWLMLPQSYGEDFIVRKFRPGDAFAEHVDYLTDLQGL